MNDAKIVQASDNIFADLGFSAQEAESLKIRADLMLTLRELIRSQNWSIEQAAEKFATSDAQIEALMKGEIEQFQLESLIAMLAQVGMKVQVEVLPNIA